MSYGPPHSKFPCSVINSLRNERCKGNRENNRNKIFRIKRKFRMLYPVELHQKFFLESNRNDLLKRLIFIVIKKKLVTVIK